jgi:biotin carboxylase
MSSTRAHRLIISYDLGSQSLFALNEAALDLCDLVWLVDLSTPAMVQMARLMSRMGTVVDVANRTESQVVEDLAATAPTGLLSLSDRTAVWLSGIARTLGLDFHSPETAHRLSDKLVQRQALRAAGISTPAFADVPVDPQEADLAWLAREIGFPAVLKPRQSNGSRNTYRVHDRAELTRLVTGSGARQQEPAGMILEGYLPETEREISRFDAIVSVESFVRDGAVHHFAITGRLPFAEPFRETGLFLPSDLLAGDAEAAEETAGAAITALGVRHGCLHTELKFTPDGPRVIEVNGRIGGGIPQLVALAGGDTSVVRLGMELALGLPVVAELPIRYSRVGWQRMVPPPVSAERIDAIAGLGALRELPGIDQVTLNRDAGEIVDWRRGLQDFVFQVYGSGADHDEIQAQCAAVDRVVTVTYNERLAGDLTRRTVRTP